MHTTFVEPALGDIPARQSAVPVYAWVVFALTVGLLLSDYMSRQVLNAVFPLIKSAWGLSDTRLGSLSSVVALMVGLLTFPLSVLADRWGRIRSLVLMATLWSLATLGCAIAQSYGEMLVARALVGVGEAAYGSVGIAVVLSIFPRACEARSPVSSWRVGLLVRCWGWRSAASFQRASDGGGRLGQWGALALCWSSPIASS